MSHTTAPRFGIATAPQQVTYRDVLRVWREADSIPQIEHAWVFDPLLPIAGALDEPRFRVVARPATRCRGKNQCRGSDADYGLLCCVAPRLLEALMTQPHARRQRHLLARGGVYGAIDIMF